MQLVSGDVFIFKLVGSATRTKGTGIIEYKCDLKDGTTISETPHTVKASFTINTNYNTIEVHEAIIDGTEVKKNLGDMMKHYL